MKTTRVIALALLSGLAVASTGCATIISGKYQAVTIHSTPPGAQVKVGHQTGVTPVTLHISKSEDYPIVVSQGPDKRVLPFHRNIDPMTLLNIIPPLWPGFLVDAFTGAITKYDPDVIWIDFRTAAHARDTQLVRYGW